MLGVPRRDESDDGLILGSVDTDLSSTEEFEVDTFRGLGGSEDDILEILSGLANSIGVNIKDFIGHVSSLFLGWVETVAHIGDVLELFPVNRFGVR